MSFGECFEVGYQLRKAVCELNRREYRKQNADF